jgi:hypothetical protein
MEVRRYPGLPGRVRRGRLPLSPSGADDPAARPAHTGLGESTPPSTRGPCSPRRRVVAYAREGGVIVGGDASSVNLTEGADFDRERELEALLVVRNEGPLRQGSAGRECLHLEYEVLALQLAEGDYGITGRAPRDVVGS